ncbi:hypothetical protein MRX96_054600 [Rhipicephalus microplus]
MRQKELKAESWPPLRDGANDATAVLPECRPVGILNDPSLITQLQITEPFPGVERPKASESDPCEGPLTSHGPQPPPTDEQANISALRKGSEETQDDYTHVPYRERIEHKTRRRILTKDGGKRKLSGRAQTSCEK